MSYVRVYTITVPRDKQERFEEHYRGQAEEVSGIEGFERFELLRPQHADDPYIVYTRWSTGSAFTKWQSAQDYGRSHSGGGDALAPLAEDNERTSSYEVVQSIGGPDVAAPV